MNGPEIKKTGVSLLQENYIRLMLLINKNALSILRGMFTKKWMLMNGTEWGNTVDSGSNFIRGYGKNVYNESKLIQKNILKSGNITEWDLPLLIQAIKSLYVKGEDESVLLINETISRGKRNKNFDTLKYIRNKLAHSGDVELDTEKFEKMWQSVSKVLISFGSSKSELEAAKIAPLLEDKGKHRVNEENTEKPRLAHLILDDLPNLTYQVTTIQNLETLHMESLHTNLIYQTQCAESATFRELNDLCDPYRTFIIQDHRQKIQNMMQPGQDNLVWEANPAKLKSKTPVDLVGLKTICFQNMDATKDHIYEGFVIKLCLIEDAVLGRPSIAQIGEDDNGDAQRLFIYNFPQNEETQESLGFGCKISIVNPYFRLTTDGKPAIRVDDPALLFQHPNQTDKTRCRYCGKETNTTTVMCLKCRRSFYCSNKCLTQDASDLNHELVCLKHL